MKRKKVADPGKGFIAPFVADPEYYKRVSNKRGSKSLRHVSLLLSNHPNPSESLPSPYHSRSGLFPIIPETICE